MDPIEEVKSYSNNSNSTRRQADELEESPDSLGVLFKRCLPILLLVALLAFLYWFWNTSCIPKANAVSAAVTNPAISVDSSVHQ
jgi:hypothetical protein